MGKRARREPLCLDRVKMVLLPRVIACLVLDAPPLILGSDWLMVLLVVTLLSLDLCGGREHKGTGISSTPSYVRVASLW